MLRFGSFFCFFLLIYGSAFSADLKIKGEIQQKIPLSKNKMMAAKSSQALPSKTITLMGVSLSEKGVKTYQNRANRLSGLNLKQAALGDEFPSAVQLGMNEVPVLDQGIHGSCVTFANTAAIDALLDKGDHISQLCHLQLGEYLENHAYTYSGWQGTMAPAVLNQIATFGFISKDKQKNLGCGGVVEYPVYEAQPMGGMSVEEFEGMSDPVDENTVGWTTLLDFYQSVLQETNTQETLMEVRKALKSGDRVTFAVLLVDISEGSAGAVGTYHKENDSWILTHKILRDMMFGGLYNAGAHEMVITGYDDNATLTDDDGKVHQGILTLRNSWGESVGDGGDFYMSYDYFKTLVIEAHRIRQLS